MAGEGESIALDDRFNRAHRFLIASIVKNGIAKEQFAYLISSANVG